MFSKYYIGKPSSKQFSIDKNNLSSQILQLLWMLNYATKVNSMLQLRFQKYKYYLEGGQARLGFTGFILLFKICLACCFYASLHDLNQRHTQDGILWKIHAYLIII